MEEKGVQRLHYGTSRAQGPA